MLDLICSSGDTKIYRCAGDGSLERLIATTPETRSICNDPRIAGIAYTDALKQACTSVLKSCSFGLTEESTVVVNVLRGGLNFGLREALARAYGWNSHTCRLPCFLGPEVCRGCAFLLETGSEFCGTGHVVCGISCGTFSGDRCFPFRRGFSEKDCDPSDRPDENVFIIITNGKERNE